MLQQRIQASDEVAAAVAKALPIVAQLAVERSKKWPANINQRHRHGERIASLEAELDREAAKVDGVTGNELERLGRAELKRRGRPVPAVAPDMGDRYGGLAAAEGAVCMVRDTLEREERSLRRQSERVERLRVDLQLKQREVARIRAAGRRAA